MSADIFSEWVKSLLLASISFTYTANGKSQIQVENFSKIKPAQKTLMDKKLRETTYLCVEIMNSKRQVKRKLGHVVQISESSCLVFST